MIRLDSVSKRYGSQVLFVDGSFAVFRGEKVGLVGPNGSGKSTIFRLVVKQEAPDAGVVAVDRGTVIGYFSQDVGDMKGQSVVSATLDGAGPVSEAAARLRDIEQKLSDPGFSGDMDKLLEEFGEAQSRFEELGGYALDARAREILAGLGFSQEVMDGDVGKLSGGWKMRVALARILLMKPDAMLLDEPTNHLDLESIIWLEKFLNGLRRRPHHDLARSRVHEPHRRQRSSRSTAASSPPSPELRVLRPAARRARRPGARAQFERQQAMLAKEEAFIARFKRPSEPRRAGAVTREEARQDRAARAAEAEEEAEFDFPEPPRSGDDVATPRRGEEGLRLARDLRLARPLDPAPRALVRDGRERRGQIDAAEAHRGRDPGRIRATWSSARASSSAISRSTPWSSSTRPRPSGTCWSTSSRTPRSASLKTLAGVFGFSGPDVEKPCKVLSGGEKARVVLALMLYDPPNFLVLDEPTNHLDMDTKEMLVEALRDYEGTLLFVSHDRHFLRELSNRVLEVGTDGVRAFGGGYTEYVAQTGYEAPGVHT